MADLTSYEWTLKAGNDTPAIVRIAQDDYDDGVQRLVVFYSDNTVVQQKRDWTQQGYVKDYSRIHDVWLNEYADAGFDASLAFIEANSTVLEEEVRENVALEAYFLRPETCSLEGIEQISMEFANTFLTENRVVRAVTEKFEHLSLQFQQFAVVRSRIKNFGFDGNQLRKLEHKLDLVQYTDLLDVKIFCAPGQVADHLTMLQALTESQKAAQAVIHDGIRPLRTYLGNLLNSRDGLQSVRSNSGIKIENPKKANARLMSALSESSQTERTYAELIRKQKDWSELRAGVDKLLSDYEAINPDVMRKELGELQVLLNAFTDRLAQAEGSGIPAATAKATADVIFELAQGVEFYAVYSTVLRAWFTALNDSVVKLVKLIR